jgi:hypothetical protein
VPVIRSGSIRIAPRAAAIASVIERADEPLIRARPALVAGKYARMASDPFAYYRGSLAVYRHDWETDRFGASASDFSLDAPRAGEAAQRIDS